jgi:hypothetical protein
VCTHASSLKWNFIYFLAAGINFVASRVLHAGASSASRGRRELTAGTSAARRWAGRRCSGPRAPGARLMQPPKHHQLHRPVLGGFCPPCLVLCTQTPRPSRSRAASGQEAEGAFLSPSSLPGLPWAGSWPCYPVSRPQCLGPGLWAWVMEPPPVSACTGRARRQG